MISYYKPFLLIVLMLIVGAVGCQTPTGQPVSSARSTGLDELTRLHDGRPMRASSADPNWQTGNKDSRPIHPGKTVTLAELDGPGVIRHIWLTINAKELRAGRSLVLRMYWDGRSKPAVEAPLGDFFAVGNGARCNVDSLPVSVNSEGRAFSCYWSMPFAKHARITLTNESTQRRVGVYWYVDYDKVPALPPNTPYFHAQYRQEYPAKLGQNYMILDAEGNGHYVGTVLSVYTRTGAWFGEGDDFFYIDGEHEPSLRGTGTEDYLGDAWGFREFNRPYYGVVMFEGFIPGSRICFYRWHIKDPIRFTKSLKFEIEHKGGMFDKQGKQISYFHERPDLYSSVAFWYQTGEPKRFATLPPAEQRVVPSTIIEMEELLKSVKPAPFDVKVDTSPSNMLSGAKQLRALFKRGKRSTLIVPFELASNTKGIARLRLATFSDYGIFSVALDGKTIIPTVDLYSLEQSVKEMHLGMLELDAGEHRLIFQCRGRNPNSAGFHLGVDALTIDEITPYAVPAVAK